MESMYKDRTLTGMSQEGQSVRQKAADLDRMLREKEMDDNMQRGYNYAKEEQAIGAAQARAARGMFGDAYDAVANYLGEMFSSDAPAKPTVSSFVDQRNAEMGAQLKADMENTARDEAFMEARKMGDMSEGNINRLMIQKFKERGL